MDPILKLADSQSEPVDTHIPIQDLSSKNNEDRPVNEVSEVAPKGSRAGRNLKAAILVGVLFGGLVAVLLVLSPQAFFMLIVGLTVYAEWEVTVAFRQKAINIIYIPLAVGSVGILCCAYKFGAEAAWGAVLLTVLCCALWRLMGSMGDSAIRDVISTVLVCVYIPVSAVFVVLLQANVYAPALLALWILATVSNDTGGYAAGVLFGKHPMLPSVSPKKSWEGFIGSVLLTTLTVCIGFKLMGIAWVCGLILGPICAAIATLGDFGESLIKRNLGVKDMGNILPGHGGIMDRLDSLLMTAPLFFLWFFFI